MHIVVNRRAFLVYFALLLIYIVYNFSSSDLFLRKTNSLSNEDRDLHNWIDFKLLVQDKYRQGPGENGVDEFLNDQAEINLNDRLYQETGFSVIVSNKISVNRSLPDMVHPDCKNMKYSRTLPKVSVVIIYHNEVLSVLLRTVHSVINRTPAELLHEVILVNDNSTLQDLYQPLDDYVAKYFPRKVKIKNLKKRSGLIVTRMEGARMATGEVLVFFDSHVEVHFNWLPPLLQPIIKNRRIATLPIIDYFDPFTFGYIPDQESFQGDSHTSTIMS